MDNNAPVNQAAYMDNAIRAVREKKQVPEIDFTLHTMEDGQQVSTQERVCKGTFRITTGGRWARLSTVVARVSSRNSRHGN